MRFIAGCKLKLQRLRSVGTLKSRRGWCNEKYLSVVNSDGSIVAIWKRAIRPEAGSFSPADAKAMLRLKLAQADLERADALAAKARAGKLSPKEEQQLDNYLAVGSVLEFLKSKARRSLREAKVAA